MKSMNSTKQNYKIIISYIAKNASKQCCCWFDKKFLLWYTGKQLTEKYPLCISVTPDKRRRQNE